MSWQKKKLETIADVFRFIGYAFLIFDGIVLGFFTFWFTCRFIGHLIDWLDRNFFQGW